LREKGGGEKIGAREEEERKNRVRERVSSKTPPRV
jgi:hypothetical protein